MSDSKGIRCQLNPNVFCKASADVIITHQCLGCSEFEARIINNPRVLMECDYTNEEVERIICRHEAACRGARA